MANTNQTADMIAVGVVTNPVTYSSNRNTTTPYTAASRLPALMSSMFRRGSRR